MALPLQDIRVVELAGIGPAPHACMILADLGAEVVRVIRPRSSETPPTPAGFTLRGRTPVEADLKTPSDLALVRNLVSNADVLVESFRPGVAERLGLGPAVFADRNQRLIYARMTGWGQFGPLAARAGHDINYIAVTGALHAVGLGSTPIPPLNLVGDYGGGSLFLVVGILAALHERSSSDKGQVLDVAMVDGVSVLLQAIWELYAQGTWSASRQANILDGGAPFYRTYGCADGKHVAVGAIEPQFYEALLAGLGLNSAALPSQQDRSHWSELHDTFTTAFLTRTRDEWDAVFVATDACVSPVLSFDEAAAHPHLQARGTLHQTVAGMTASPAPRFSRTPMGSAAFQDSASDLQQVCEAWRS